MINEEDKKLQEDLVNEMMKVSKTNPDVMIYMQSLMKCYEDLEKENQQLKNNRDKELAEHYKHLYSELKKQKDDVVEYIKSLQIYGLKYSKTFYSEVFTGILRMLGEIDD